MTPIIRHGETWYEAMLRWQREERQRKQFEAESMARQIMAEIATNAARTKEPNQ